MSTARATKIFDRLTAKVGVSDAGKAWLITALDPFHDEPIEGLRGLPDGINTDVVVQKIKTSNTIRCPSSITSGTWDAHILSAPFDVTTNVADTWAYDGVSSVGSGAMPLLVQLPAPSSAPIGGITVVTGATPSDATQPTIYPFNTSSTQILSRQTIAPASNFTNGTYRVIGKGYELISVGPDLYKSGTAYTYRVPAINDFTPSTTDIWSLDSTGVYQNTKSSVLRYPIMPRGTNDITEIPNSRFWPAKEGVYMVDTLTSPYEATFSGNAVSAVYTGYNSGSRDATGDGKIGSSIVAPAYNASTIGLPDLEKVTFAGVTGLTTPLVNVQPGIDFSPYNHSGVYLAGLNPQDVYTLNVIWYIERLPGMENQDMLVLAKPSPHLDPQALEMYSVIISEMPCGMYSSANGLGDWFKGVADFVLDNVAPALSVIPGPIGNIAKAVTVGGGLVRGLLKGSSKPEVRRADAPNSYDNQPNSVVIEEVPVPATNTITRNFPLTRVPTTSRNNLRKALKQTRTSKLKTRAPLLLMP